MSGQPREARLPRQRSCLDFAKYNVEEQEWGTGDVAATTLAVLPAKYLAWLPWMLVYHIKAGSPYNLSALSCGVGIARFFDPKREFLWFLISIYWLWQCWLNVFFSRHIINLARIFSIAEDIHVTAKCHMISRTRNGWSSSHLTSTNILFNSWFSILPTNAVQVDNF